MTKSSDPNAFMTPGDTANYIGISDRTLSRWHSQRVGPPRIKIGGRVLYRREMVLEWMINNEQAPLRSFSNGTAKRDRSDGGANAHRWQRELHK